jgi:pimeloyl-ACP methyl ester carboxylesterase
MFADTAHLDGLTVHYHVEGHGPDVVLIHGWGSSRRMWHHLTAALAARFRCWSLDLPGFGDSDRPTHGWYSMPNYTATVYHFLEMMGLRQARVVGHSMGGLISLDYAATHPERVTRLVAINPVVTGRAYLRPFAEWGRGARVLDRTLRLSRRLVTPVLGNPVTNGLHRGVEHIHRRTDDFARTTPDALLAAGRALVDYDVFPRLSRITAPTLIVLGSLDANVPNSEGHLAAVEIPGARLAVLTAGHLVTDDRPAETMALLQGFLA